MPLRAFTYCYQEMVVLAGVEPATVSLTVRCSIHLSYSNVLSTGFEPVAHCKNSCSTKLSYDSYLVLFNRDTHVDQRRVCQADNMTLLRCAQTVA